MRSYLFVFDLGKFDRQRVIDAIDDLPTVENWYAFMPNAMCLASAQAPKDLSEAIRQALPGLNFIVARLEKEGKGGWLRRSVWRFINEPKAVDLAGETRPVDSRTRRRSA